jgi:hypothetical protein
VYAADFDRHKLRLARSLLRNTLTRYLFNFNFNFCKLPDRELALEHRGVDSALFRIERRPVEAADEAPV